MKKHNSKKYKSKSNTTYNIGIKPAKNEERYAGPSYMNSPDPSTLPMPSFSLFNKGKDDLRLEKDLVLMNQYELDKEIVHQNKNTSDVTFIPFLRNNYISNLNTIENFINIYIKKCSRLNDIAKIILYELEDIYKFKNYCLNNILNSNSYYFDKRIEISIKLLILKYSNLSYHPLLLPPSFFS